MKTIRFQAEIAINAGYNDKENGKVTMDLEQMGTLVQQAQEKTEKATGICISVIVSGPNRTCYPMSYGCPPGGEISYTIYSLADYRQKISERNWRKKDWQKAVLIFMDQLRKQLLQDDVNVEFIDSTGVDSYVLSNDISLEENIRELNDQN